MSAQRPTIVGVVVLLFLILHTPVSADVRINEFSSQTNPEWVELYNPDEEIRGLSGVVLYFADTIDTSQKIAFCTGTILSGKTYGRVIRPDGSYWLSNAGDTLMLKREDDVIDSITFGNQLLKAPVGTQSAARNDAGVWIISDSPSPSGDVINLVCPTMSPTNTPTATVTNTPTTGTVPTPSSTPAHVSASIPTHQPTSYVRVISTVLAGTPSETEGAVLGQIDQHMPATAAATATTNIRPYITALLFVGIGLSLLTAVSLLKIRYTNNV